MKMSFHVLFVNLILILGWCAVSNANDVCSRNQMVVWTLEDNLKKPCLQISANDLSSIKSLDFWDDGGPEPLYGLKRADFEGLSHLESLTFIDVHFTSLPSDLFLDLVSLQQIRMDIRTRTEIPEGLFDGLKSLSQVFIGGDSIVLQPGSFRGLTALKILSMRNAQLTRLPRRIFRDLKSLQILDLAYNKLISIPPDVFSGLSSLEELNLSDSYLQTLPVSVFRDLRSLRGLYLGGNALTRLPGDVFDSLTSLTQLTLNHNVLSHINKSVFVAPYFASGTCAVDLSENDIPDSNKAILATQIKSVKF